MLRFLTRLSGRRRHVCRSCGAPAPNSSLSSSSSAAAAASSLSSPLPSPETLKLDCRLNHSQDKEDNYDVRLGCCYSRLRSHQLHDHHSHHHHPHHQEGYLDLDADNQSRQESSSSRHTASSDNRLLQDSFDDSFTRITGLRTTSTTIPTISSSKRDFTINYNTNNTNNNNNNNNNKNNNNNNIECGNVEINNSKQILQTRQRTRRETCRDTNRTVDTIHRRNGIPSYLATILLLSYALFGIADACSSKSTPKPRPPTTTARPSITFRQNPCPPDYAEWYCLNQATCFTVKIQDSLLYNCLCADGFVGQRCEFKDLEGSYTPSRQRMMLETASIAGGATIAVFLVVIICIAAYIHCKRKQKELRARSGTDTVDGVSRDPELRPFSRNRSIAKIMAKNQHFSPIMFPSIEQTRMPSWNVELTRLASVNEGKRSSQ